MNLRSAAKTASFSVLAFGFITAASASINLNTTNDFFAANSGPSNSHNYFWANQSSDGTNCNIGFFLNNGSAGCSSVANSNFVPGSSTNLDFLSGSANGSAVATPFTFTGTGAASTLLVTITGNGNESIGYHDSAGDHTLASVPAGNVSTTINPTGSFYFFINTPSGQFTTASNPNQFALFAPGVTTGSAAGITSLGTFYLGAEDTAIGTGDNDYNDMVIKVTSATPEPGFYGALAVGFSGLVLAVKRRRKA